MRLSRGTHPKRTSSPHAFDPVWGDRRTAGENVSETELATIPGYTILAKWGKGEWAQVFKSHGKRV